MAHFHYERQCGRHHMTDVRRYPHHCDARGFVAHLDLEGGLDASNAVIAIEMGDLVEDREVYVAVCESAAGLSEDNLY